MQNRLSLIFGLGLLLFGCSKSELSLSSFVEWNRENPIISVVETENYVFTLTLVPNDLMCLKELKSEVNTLPKDSITQILVEYDQGSYFILKLESKDPESSFLRSNLTSDNEYYSRIEYLSTSIPFDIKKIQNNDTSFVSNHLFERTFGIRPHENVIIYFNESLDPSSNCSISFDSPYDTKPLNFKFNSDDLQAIPRLKI